MTFLPSLPDFIQRSLVEPRTGTPAQKVLASIRGERTPAATVPAATAVAPAKMPADATAEAPEAKAWTAQEIALATFWVAG